jgi:GTP cyclohydrolase II
MTPARSTLALASPPAAPTPPLAVRVVARAELPSRHGPFTVVAFLNDRERAEHVALVRGDPTGREEVLTRMHSECLTGDAFGSLRCDCRDQLDLALQRLAREEVGVLVYLRQEGRGIGLVNKIRAYALQDTGLDTVEANRALGFADDERDYAVAAAMLQALGVRSVKLLTNNPYKILELERHGLRVAARVPHAVPANAHNRFYLDTKARRSGHLFDVPDGPEDEAA